VSQALFSSGLAEKNLPLIKKARNEMIVNPKKIKKPSKASENPIV
jgi:hypothetical protein